MEREFKAAMTGHVFIDRERRGLSVERDDFAPGAHPGTSSERREQRAEVPGVCADDDLYGSLPTRYGHQAELGRRTQRVRGRDVRSTRECCGRYHAFLWCHHRLASHWSHWIAVRWRPTKAVLACCDRRRADFRHTISRTPMGRQLMVDTKDTRITASAIQRAPYSRTEPLGAASQVALVSRTLSGMTATRSSSAQPPGTSSLLPPFAWYAVEPLAKVITSTLNPRLSHGRWNSAPVMLT